MCPSKPEPIKNIVPAPPPAPEKAPEPVEVKKPSESDGKRRGRNSLRIDLAASTKGKSGVNI